MKKDLCIVLVAVCVCIATMQTLGIFGVLMGACVLIAGDLLND